MNRAWRSSVLLAALLGVSTVAGNAQVFVRRTGGSPVADWLSLSPSAFGVQEWRVGQWARYSMSENVGAPMPMARFRTNSIVGRRGADYWVEIQEEVTGMMRAMMPVRKLAVPFGALQPRVGTEELLMNPEDSSVRRQVLLRAGSGGGQGPSFPQGWTRVGEEEVTTPAGTFRTIHYRRGSEDLWAAGGAGPVGLVRFRSADLEIELVSRGETGARSLIPFGGGER